MLGYYKKKNQHEKKMKLKRDQIGKKNKKGGAHASLFIYFTIVCSII